MSIPQSREGIWVYGLVDENTYVEDDVSNLASFFLLRNSKKNRRSISETPVQTKSYFRKP